MTYVYAYIIILNMKEINGFKLWEKEPNTICDGARVFTKEIYFKTKNRYKNRLIRVYLPSTYDFSDSNKRFPVIYMLDGKNLFDDHTSFVGEWGVDETIEESISNGETSGIIVVGVDAPKNGKARALEMIPKGIKARESRLRNIGDKDVYAELLGDYIFKLVKPIIDETFYTLPDKYHTGVGGSSMGGLMAFYLATEYSEYCNYSLAFSPAFFLFEEESFNSYLEYMFNRKQDIGNIYFYVGGVGFEKQFVKSTNRAFQFMKDIGYTDTQIKYVYDKTQEHNEKAWRIYFPDALKFFNYLK